MTRWIANTLGIVLILAVACAVFAGWRLYPHLTKTIDSWNGASTLKKANDTLDAISGPRGTLHEVNKIVVKMGDAVVTTQLGERKTFPHVIAATDALTEAAHSGSTAALAVSGTADQATATLRTTQSTVAAFQPLAASLTRTTDASTRAVDDFDAILRSPDLTQAIQHANGTLGHVDAMTGDAQRVSDDLTRRYFAPVPWYKKVGQDAEFGVKVGNKLLGWW